MDDVSDLLAGMDREQKLRLLGRLLNDLHAEKLVSQETLVQIASEVMALDYHDDDDFIVFTHLEHEIEEE
ncbi:hypothetical protein GGR28_003016 [Lewinella aquimaris]|uniref:Uncharacterized protein n=1 Tax=Neolewinella aquimaris TaxID=1835722 RepID=A0A840E9I1_9BACT|nr:hypothetical protein [Neolewinella aquimaris]MBB4080382.1 hypothetical protein [Neolewinella aquimaris]